MKHFIKENSRLSWSAKELMTALIFGLGIQSVWATPMTVRVLDMQAQPVSDAVVSWQRPADPVLAKPLANVEISQKNKRFHPYVTVITKGTALRFPNLDTVRHHVYSFSSAKRFDLKLFHGREAAPVVFDKTGLVAIGCNIHDWMLGYIKIVDTPYFAVTDSQGVTVPLDLPAGQWQVSVWHPRLRQEQRQSITLPPAGNPPSGNVLMRMSYQLPDPRPQDPPLEYRKGAENSGSYEY